MSEKRKKYGVLVLGGTIISILIILVLYALANTLLTSADPTTALAAGEDSFRSISRTIINFALYFLGLLATVGFIVGIIWTISDACSSSSDYSGKTKLPKNFVQYAGFWRRVAVMYLDTIFVIITLLIGGIFNIVFYFRDGQTIGDKILGCRLISRETGKKPSTGELFGRYFAKILSRMALNIGFLPAAWREEKNAWHDSLSGTRYIETKKVSPWWTVLIVGVLGAVHIIVQVVSIAAQAAENAPM